MSKIKILILVVLITSLNLVGCSGGTINVAPPFIRIIGGQVDIGTSSSFTAAQDNTQLSKGDTIKTGAESRAVLFFEEGTQIELEPETELTIEDVDGISVSLSNGSVWFAANQAIATLDAGGPLVTAQNGGFWVSKSDQDIFVSSVGSKIELESGETKIEIPSGYYSVVQPNGTPSTPEQIEVNNALRIVLEGEALVFISDPEGRSLGYHPYATITLNHIPNGWYSGKESRPQIISIPNIDVGEYIIILVAAANQTSWRISIGIGGEDLEFSELTTSSSITWGTPTGIYLNVRINPDGDIIAERSDIWTLYSNPPGFLSLVDTLKRVNIHFGKEAPFWVGLE